MLPGFMSPTKSNAKRESISEYKALSRVPVGGFASRDILVDGLQADTQERDNWCWAAVGAALLAIQEGEFGQSQCKIANMYAGRSSYQSINEVLLRGNCCDPSVDADTAGLLNEVLDILRISNGGWWARGNLDDEIGHMKAKLRDGRPVPVFIDWPSSNIGHFVVIFGFSKLDGQPAVHIYDPAKSYRNIGNVRLVTIRKFANNYDGGGRWTHGYDAFSTGRV